MVLLNIAVVKRDDRKEAYEREKVEQGIKGLWKKADFARRIQESDQSH